MSRAHDAGLRDPEAKNEVVSPQGDVVVPTASGAGFLGVDRATGNMELKARVKVKFCSVNIAYGICTPRGARIERDGHRPGLSGQGRSLREEDMDAAAHR